MTLNVPAFRGELDFCSNFYPAIVVYDNEERRYPTVEHGFVMKRLMYAEDIAHAQYLTAGAVKRFGREMYTAHRMKYMNEAERLDLMAKLLRSKFRIPELAERLIATGDEPLVEYNNWHDNFWGDCKCGPSQNCRAEGRNYLGQMLMAIRSSL